MFYTLEEAATVLHRSTKSVRRLISSGQLRRDPTIYRILIPRADVDSFANRAP
jgi:excisionase family DNA binding protein